MNGKNKKYRGLLVLLLIILLFVGAIVDRININRNPALTETEWVAMLADTLGVSELDFGQTDEIATGEYAALTSMEAIGSDRIKELTLEDVSTEQEYIDSAVELGIISKSQLSANISEELANNILLDVIDIYLGLDDYPEYCDIDYNDEVITSESIETHSYDEETGTLEASFSDGVPEAGQVIVFQKNNGIAAAKKVTDVIDNGNGDYTIQSEDVDDLSEIAETISFSGKGDFSSLVDDDSDSAVLIDNSYQSASYDEEDPLLLAAYPPRTLTTYGLFEWFDEKTTFTAYSATDKADIEIDFEIDSDGVDASGSISAGGKKVSISKSDDDNSSDDKDNSLSADASISGSIEISDLQIAASGYFKTTDWANESNYVKVSASSDVKFNVKVNNSIEGKYCIKKFPIPIAQTGNTLVVNLEVYLIATASGEISLTYEIDDCYAGIYASTATGVKTPHRHGDDSFSLDAQIELTGGVLVQANCKLFDYFDLATPAIDCVAKAGLETLEKNEGYEEYPPCAQLELKGPIITFYPLGTDGSDDTVLGMFAEKLNVTVEIELISEDKAPTLLNLHIETDLEGDVSVLKGTAEDVCTHVKEETAEDLLDDTKDDIEDSINDEIEKQKQALIDEIMEAIADVFNDILEESCEGCL